MLSASILLFDMIVLYKSSPRGTNSSCPEWQTVPSCSPTHLAPLPVMPAYPADAVAAVRDPVALGELVPHAVGVAALGAHQCDEVQRAKVHLQVLFEAARP